MRTGSFDNEGDAESEREFDGFVAKWRRNLSRPTAVWEGHFAIGELKRAAYPIDSDTDPRKAIDFVRCEPGTGSKPREMLWRVFREVEHYKEKILQWDKKGGVLEAKKIELLLAKIGLEMHRQSKRAQDAEHGKILMRTFEDIEVNRQRLKQYRERAERFSPLGAWEGLWQRNPRITVQRMIDLDARLQQHAAMMFRVFLREDIVSLATIARLVVLVYLTCDLAQDDGAELIYAMGKRKHPKISVRSVSDKLRLKPLVPTT